METGWWEIPRFASGHYLVEAIGGKIASEQDNDWILMEEAAAALWDRKPYRLA